MTAPGKLMVAGEYAVLRSRRAVVTAVDRRARVEVRPPEAADLQGAGESSTLPPEVLATRRLAEGAWGAITGSLHLRVDALREAGRKLGLGSSAAAAAACAGAVCIAARGSLDVPREELLDVAYRGHRAVAPGGSGADVAAAVLGGWVRLFPSSSLETIAAESVAWPPVETRVVWTGVEARTSRFVARVRALEADQPEVYQARLDAIEAAADSMVSAGLRGDVAGLIRGTREHHVAMAALGDAIDSPVVEARLERIAQLAEQSGGAAKPSGAGGGDVALAFFPEPDAAEHFTAQVTGAGFQLLALDLGAEGVRREVVA